MWDYADDPDILLTYILSQNLLAKRDATKKLREEGKKPIGLPQKRGA